MKHTFLFAATAAMMAACSTPQAEVVEGTSTVELDGYSVSWISDTPEPRNNSLELFPTASKELADSLGLQDGIPASMSAFLLRSEDGDILFDAGLGAPFSQLQPRLSALGVAPEDIEYVFITHLHHDHVGGLMAQDSTAAFPNAKLYLNKAECEAWSEMPAEKTAGLFGILGLYADRTVLFDAGETLPLGVEAIDAAGHTPGHTIFRKGNLLIAGDVMHAVALQMADPAINAVYDMDQEKAAAARVQVVSFARENGLLLCGMHFPEPGFIDFR